MSEPSLKVKLAWQCRRGMLELDIIFIPFLEQHFDSLSDDQQLVFCELLKEADPDLYSWLMGYVQCQQPDFDMMIKLIKTNLGISKSVA